MCGLFDCVICQRLLSDTKFSNNCGHVFCGQCLEDYLGYPPTLKTGALKTCPICKVPIGGSTLKPPAIEYEMVYRMAQVNVTAEDVRKNKDKNVIQNLFVITLNGKTINIGQKSGVNTKISEIKNLIYYSEGIKPSKQMLMWSGIILEDDKTLEDYGIGEDCTIHLMARLLGCIRCKEHI